MEKRNKNLEEEQTISQYLNDIKAFISNKNEKEKNKLYEKLKIAKKNLMKITIPENIVRSTIINYIINYTNVNYLSKNKEAKKLVDEFIKYFPEKNVVEISLESLNKKFKEPSPLAIILSFTKDISIDKYYLEFHFKILFLLHNINDIIESMNNLLGIKNNAIKELLERLNFQNPYAILLIKDLINEMIINKNDIKIEDVLKEVINDIKHYYPLYCPNCFEILLIVYSQNISLYCPKEKTFFYPKHIFDLKNILTFNIKCIKCHKNIEIYDNNYKCNDCKYIFCQQCAKEHEKIDMKNVLINLYEIGYICEEHYELYSTSCNICQINLCEICKENHVHKVDAKNILSLDESLLKINSSKNLNEITTIKEYLLTRLSIMYQYMRNFPFNNYTIRVSIYFGEKYNKINKPDTKKFYFSSFFGESTFYSPRTVLSANCPRKK